MRMVSPLTPRVFATLYSLFWVPFKISFCCPRSPNTALPRSRNSSSCVLAFEKKDCSRRACDSRVKFCWVGFVPKEMEVAEEGGANGELLGRAEVAYGFSGVPAW